MAYDKFITLTDTAVPLQRDHVDTDQIIPARFLKATERIGFGDNLFYDWRYDDQHKPNPNFELNNPSYKGKILVGGRNFGCGSSREHAVWAIYDYGFRCVVSSFFADIFKNNCFNIGVLPVTVSDEFLQLIFKSIKEKPDTEISIDLPSQTIRMGEHSETFEINSYKKNNMMNGFDDIDYLLNSEEEITQFEKQRSALY